MDVIKLAMVVDSNAILVKAWWRKRGILRWVDSTGIDGKPEVMSDYLDRLATWIGTPEKFQEPSQAVTVALALYYACMARSCPLSVQQAAANAVSGHNRELGSDVVPRYGVGSYAANLQAANFTSEIVSRVFDDSDFVSVLSSFKISQPRECMVHGCIKEDDTKIIQVVTVTDNDDGEDTSRRKKGGGGSTGTTILAGVILRNGGSNGPSGDFTQVEPGDIVDAYISDTSTLHWLWRLQGDEEAEWEGVKFKLLKIGGTTVWVYCRTLQQYESSWLALCWILFGVRLALLIFIDGILMSTTIKCQQLRGNQGNAAINSEAFQSLDANNDGVVSKDEFMAAYGEKRSDHFDELDTNADGVLTQQEFEAKEVAFLDCLGSWRARVFMLVLFALDFGSLVNPIVNATDVQQGEFEWASNHLQMVDLLGFTGCKLELALVPSIITVAGRMLTGDDDTRMEAFLYELAIFVMPIVLGKMGYGFEVNTSTLFTIFTAMVVAIRFALRISEHSVHLGLHCTDDTREVLEEAEGDDEMIMQAALGALPAGKEVELDWVCAFRQHLLGSPDAEHCEDACCEELESTDTDFESEEGCTEIKVPTIKLTATEQKEVSEPKQGSEDSSTCNDSKVSRVCLL